MLPQADAATDKCSAKLYDRQQTRSHMLVCLLFLPLIAPEGLRKLFNLSASILQIEE